MKARFLDPMHWVLLLFGIAAILFSIGVAFADDKLQKQVISLTAQLDGNCSATLIHSKRARSDSFIGLYTRAEDIHAYLKVALPEAVAQ